jgi:hypothetical protein
MNSNRIVWIGMAIGSTIGGLIPVLWGASFLSFSSIITTAVGGIAGIWLGFKLG